MSDNRRYYSTTINQPSTEVFVTQTNRIVNDFYVVPNSHQESFPRSQIKTESNNHPIIMTESYYPVENHFMSTMPAQRRDYEDSIISNFRRIQKEFMSPQGSGFLRVINQKEENMDGNKSQPYASRSEFKIKEAFETEDIANKYGYKMKRTRVKKDLIENNSHADFQRNREESHDSNSQEALSSYFNQSLKSANRDFNVSGPQKNFYASQSIQNYNFRENSRNFVGEVHNQENSSHELSQIHPINQNEFNDDLDEFKLKRITNEIGVEEGTTEGYFNFEKKHDLNPLISIPQSERYLSNKMFLEESSPQEDLEMETKLTPDSRNIVQTFDDQYKPSLNQVQHFLDSVNPVQSSLHRVKLVLENLGTYDGGMCNGKLEGYGVLSDTKGILYEGEFENNEFNGVGIMYNEPCQAECGESFQNKLPEFWTHYEGLFFKNRKEGFGKIYFKDGSCYSGEFLNDMASSFGTYQTKIGEKIIGIWKENCLVSKI